MSLWTRALCWLAERFPRQTFHGRLGPYLTRYALYDFGKRGSVVLHRFHRGDEDEELHCHRWRARGVRLAGRQREERRFPCATAAERHALVALPRGWWWHAPSGVEEAARATGFVVMHRTLGPGDHVSIEPDTYHRVDLLDDEAWTLLFIGPRVRDDWGFWDRWTGTFTPWREFLAQKGVKPA